MNTNRPCHCDHPSEGNGIRYVAKPVEIEAVEWRGNFSDIPTEWRVLGAFEMDAKGSLIVRTLEGLARPRVGDYIARGTAGEFYPVRRAIFHEKYTPAGGVS